MAQAAIDAWREIFATQKSLIERAIAQLTDEQLHEPIEPQTNPVAVILLHMAGSMRSRFTDWRTTDGEKPWRNREAEFDAAAARALSRAQIMERWEKAWTVLFAALGALGPGDLDRTVSIRAEAHTVAQALERQVSHYGYHAGQVVLISRILVQRAGGQWQHLSIPPGQTEAFNARMRDRFGAF
jgi:uncharacterized damage-inducible protein DinB